MSNCHNEIRGEIRRAEDDRRLHDAIAQNMTEGVYLVRANDGMIAYANPRLEQMFGYAPGEMVGKHVSTVNAPADRRPEETASEIMESLKRTGEWRGEVHNIRKDGSLFWCYANVSAFEHPEYGKVLISVHTDITGRKQAEERERLAHDVLEVLNRSHDAPEAIRKLLPLLKTRSGIEAVGIRLRQGDDFPYFLQDGFSDDFLRTENSLTVRTADRGVCRNEDGQLCLECTCGLVLSGKTDPANPFFTDGGSFWTNDSLPLLHLPADQDPRLHPRNRCIHEGFRSVALIPVRSGETVIGLLQFNDCRPNQFTLETIRLFERMGVSIGLALSRRRAMEELRESLKRVQDMQEQMIQQERLSALGQMASGIAHDFNNALVPVLGCTEVLLSTPGILDRREETIEMLELVRAGAMNAVETVRRLREFYRPSDPSQHRPVDLASVIRNTVALTQPKWKVEMEARNVPINVRMEMSPVPLITGDEHELGRLLTNLIFNSIDAMPKGGSITIRLHSDPSGKHAVLEVQDAGVGMSEEVRRKCLDPFFSTKGGRGVGLGLSISHGIVERHGGGIEIQSEPDRGTKVIIHLPLGESPVTPAQEKEDGSREVLPTPSLRVLFVDDEESARDLIRRFLEADGHFIQLATDGTTGLERLKAAPFDLVILDRAMPGMSGDALAAAIKARSPGTPVIMLTGFGDMMKDEGWSHAGVDLIMTKPLTREALRRSMAMVMAGSLGITLKA